MSASDSSAAPREPVPGQAAPVRPAAAAGSSCLLAVVAGLACAAVLGPLVWFAIGPEYTAKALLLLNPTRPMFVFTEDADALQRFEVFKETQISLLASSFVLSAALRDESVRGLPVIRKHCERGNAEAWLAANLRVAPERESSAVLVVSLTRPTPEEAAALVNAVVHAYWHEIIEKPQIDRQVRLNQLQQLFSDTEKEPEARSALSRLKEPALRLGTGDGRFVEQRQQMAMQQYGDSRREAEHIGVELAKARGNLALQRRLEQRLKAQEIAEAEVLPLAASDPLYRSLLERSRSTEKDKDDDADAKKELAQLIGNYREKVREMKGLAIRSEVERLETEIRVLAEQEEQFRKDADRARQEAERLASAATEVEAHRAELKRLDQTFARITDERDRLQVAQRLASDRVRIIGKPEAPAEVPDRPSNGTPRLCFSLGAALVGFCLPGLVRAVALCRARRSAGTR
jgi:capsular polysaccharide biosynthesis protein